MNDMKRDLIRIQELVGMAFSETGSLVALTDGGQMNPNKLQKTLEQTMEQFERTTLELRRLCERYSPGAGGFAHRPALPYMDITVRLASHHTSYAAAPLSVSDAQLAERYPSPSAGRIRGVWEEAAFLFSSHARDR